MKYEEILTPFQRLQLLRCFRVDRIYRAITEYVTQTMGEKYVTPPIISFESIFEQSSPMSPIVFILSPGSDPASDLMKLAERTGFGTNKLKFLSMGQGQEKVRGYCMEIHIGTIRYDGKHCFTKQGFAKRENMFFRFSENANNRRNSQKNVSFSRFVFLATLVFTVCGLGRQKAKIETSEKQFCFVFRVF